MVPVPKAAGAAALGSEAPKQHLQWWWGESGGKKELERPKAIVQQKGRPQRAASQLASWLLSYFCLLVLFVGVFFFVFFKVDRFELALRLGKTWTSPSAEGLHEA